MKFILLGLQIFLVNIATFMISSNGVLSFINLIKGTTCPVRKICREGIFLRKSRDAHRACRCASISYEGGHFFLVLPPSYNPRFKFGFLKQSDSYSNVAAFFYLKEYDLYTPLRPATSVVVAITLLSHSLRLTISIPFIRHRRRFIFIALGADDGCCGSFS